MIKKILFENQSAFMKTLFNSSFCEWFLSSVLSIEQLFSSESQNQNEVIVSLRLIVPINT